MYSSIGTHVGQVRQTNEDYAGCIQFNDGVIMVVCDGMGGHSAGDVASKMAVEESLKLLKEINYKNLLDVTKTVTKTIQKVNKTIHLRSLENVVFSGMGTTIVGAVVTEEYIFIFNVGDSRAYLLSDENTLRQMSIDHKIVNKWVAEGIITKAEAENNPSRNVLYQALGTENDVEVAIKIVPNDGHTKSVLLVTDGLTDLVTDEEITKMIAAEKQIQVKITNLIKKANKAGGKDNITAGIIELGGN